MANLNMAHSFDFTVGAVDGLITKKSAGNYALGYIKTSGNFVVKYVGRADDDLNARIKEHIGESEEYKKVKYSYAASPEEAFEKECTNYHEFGENKKLDNKMHPARPDGTAWKCPICDIYK